MVPQKESEAFIDGIERKKARNESNRANAKVESEIPNNPDEVLLHPANRFFLSCVGPSEGRKYCQGQYVEKWVGNSANGQGDPIFELKSRNDITAGDGGEANESGF